MQLGLSRVDVYYCIELNGSAELAIVSLEAEITYLSFMRQPPFLSADVKIPFVEYDLQVVRSTAWYLCPNNELLRILAQIDVGNPASGPLQSPSRNVPR